MFIIVGLGNPGKEYDRTRHNTGARFLEMFRKTAELPEWKFDKKCNALISSRKLKSDNLQLLLPQTFMNKSGEAVKKIKDLTRSNVPVQYGRGLKIKDKRREIPNLIVIHDDLDIPRGSYKLSFNKSSGGHKGVESIITALKTQAFARIRIGISPSTPKGIIKKPKGETAVERHILGNFSAAELTALKKLFPRIVETLSHFITEGREKAMSRLPLPLS